MFVVFNVGDSCLKQVDAAEILVDDMFVSLAQCSDNLLANLHENVNMSDSRMRIILINENDHNKLNIRDHQILFNLK